MVMTEIPWEYLGLFIMLGAAFLTDIQSMKIPNWITVTGMVSGVIYHGIAHGWEGVVFSVSGLAAGFGLLIMMYWLRAVGGGDVKLFGGIGAWTGIGFTLSSMMYSILIAGAIGIVILLFRRELFVRMRNVCERVLGAVILRSAGPVQAGAAKSLQFPFMIAVLPGTLLAVYYF